MPGRSLLISFSYNVLFLLRRDVVVLVVVVLHVLYISTISPCLKAAAPALYIHPSIQCCRGSYGTYFLPK